MAGLFGGLFNYDKEGPGIAKDAPKKRAFIVFFEIYWRKFWNLFLANLLFLFVNIPVLTRGIADVGLCKITRNFAREKHAFVGHDFFKTIKKNWRQALGIGVINTLVTALLIFNATYYFLGLFPWVYAAFGADVSEARPMQLTFMDYGVIAATVLGYVIFTWMKYYIPFMVVTFKLTTKEIYKNAFSFAIVGLKQNLLISLVLIVLYAFATFVMFSVPTWPVILFVLLLWALLLPSFRSLLIQFVIFPLIKKLMIDPYYEKNPDADKQQRYDLNLEVEEPAHKREEVVFEDNPLPQKENNTIPRQYGKGEMRASRNASDDDDTI